MLLFDPAGLQIADGANLAEEPRDTVAVDGAITASGAGDRVGEELRLRAAFGRAALLAGAAHGALAASVQYAGERVQFGRPIGRFQAVQQQLALAAAEVAATESAVAVAARTADADGFGAASTRSPWRPRSPARARPPAPSPGSPTRCTARSASPASTGSASPPPGCGPGATRTVRRPSGTSCSARLALDAGPAALWPLVTGTP